jgi:hypothetical protein
MAFASPIFASPFAWRPAISAAFAPEESPLARPSVCSIPLRVDPAAPSAAIASATPMLTGEMNTLFAGCVVASRCSKPMPNAS